MMKMSTSHPLDPFWRNVGLILSQYFGLVDGYKHVAPKDMVSFTQIVKPDKQSGLLGENYSCWKSSNLLLIELVVIDRKSF